MSVSQQAYGDECLFIDSAKPQIMFSVHHLRNCGLIRETAAMTELRLGSESNAMFPWASQVESSLFLFCFPQDTAV